jgi:hypothetical protein
MQFLASRAFVLAFAVAPLVAPAADLRPEQARIPTVTRLVKIFVELESELGQRLAAGDTAAIEAMLADDFEMRAGPAPGNPTPRAEWIAAARGEALRGATPEQVAVHDLGEVAIASFLQRVPNAPRSGAPARNLFVVDVWRRAGDTWKLAIRYVGPAGARDLAIPGAAREPPTIPKRY